MSALPLETTLPPTHFDRQLLTVAEVADYLRVSEMTVYRLISSRDMGATKVGRCWRVPSVDLLAYLDDQHVAKAV